MEKVLNQKYNLEITVLSPLSIGAGAERDWVKGMDYVVKNGKAYLLNLKKMIQAGINPEELSPLFAEKNHAAILGMVGGKLDAISDASFELPVNSDNDIKAFVKNELSNKPIIPGSSLKGAVRSVILDYLLDKDELKNKDDEKKYFGSSADGDELMRFIKFSDAEFDKTNIVNTKIFNLHGSGNDWHGGWKHEFRNGTTDKYQPTGFNTLYESLLPNEKGVCSLMLSESAFKKMDHIKQREKQELFKIEQLFSIINEHTVDYVDKEIAFFKKYHTDKTDKIIVGLEKIRAQIPKDNTACVLKMSAGSGFHSITGDWQYDDYSKTGIAANGKQRYKSRKVAIYNDKFYLMGFVRLQCISDEDFAIKLEGQKKKREAEIQKQKELIERQKAEQKQKTKAEYDKLILRAETLCNQESYSEAKEFALKAKQILPCDDKHESLLLKIQNCMDEAEKAKQAESVRLANLSPDEREKEKYTNTMQSEWGNLVNQSLTNSKLTKEFYEWLKQELVNHKLNKMNKWIKRLELLESKIKSL
ncbi:MAG: RAMP superfamily CRISPR-associated protein [Culturomica sp.]|jgi:CRISPR/Cas system CSM-associated protein Csm5 (group 7 of RAMP superfamily)|nr:RAMP superfamily CRISPR-associated protein [Culturomica sp.]